MKTDYEMYQSVLSKRSEYRKKKNKRIKIIKNTIPVLVCFCLIVGLGLGYWSHIGKMNIIKPTPDAVDVTIATMTETTTAVTTEKSSASDTTSSNVNQTQTVTGSTVGTTAIKTFLTAAVNTQNVTAQPIHTTVVVKHQSTSTSATVITNVTTKVHTALTSKLSTTTTMTNGFDMEGFGGDDMAVHTLTQSSTTVSTSTLSTSTTVITTTANTIDNNIPAQPINEQYGLGIIDGYYDCYYINTFKISSDYVDKYIGVIVMRSANMPFLDAKAYSIKNTSNDIAIAIAFEGYDGYYLYRSNKTAINTIKELFPDEGENLKERTIFYE